MVAEYAHNRESKECKRQASLENFAADLDKFMQEMKEDYDQSHVVGENTKPMNYDIFQKYFDFQPHILQSFYPAQLQQLLQKKKHISFERLPNFIKPSVKEN
jgi:hypothetical protein